MRHTLAGISSIITLLVLPSLIAAQELQPPREEGKFRQPDLVDLVEVDRTSRLDVRYATPNNFTGRAVYTEARAFRQRPAVGAGTSPAPTGFTTCRARPKLFPVCAAGVRVTCR